jgi:hypothetical protein
MAFKYQKKKIKDGTKFINRSGVLHQQSCYMDKFWCIPPPPLFYKLVISCALVFWLGLHSSLKGEPRKIHCVIAFSVLFSLFLNAPENTVPSPGRYPFFASVAFDWLIMV